MKIRTLIILSLTLFFSISACKSYTEGPGLTFRKAETRLSNSWVIDKVYESDGQDITDQYNDLRYLYREDGVFKFDQKISGVFTTQYEGTWELINDKETVVVNIQGTFVTASDTLQILRLTKDSFWYTNTSDKEFRLIPETES